MALWGGDGTNAGQTIKAGLPEITGEFGSVVPTNHAKTATGAFSGMGKSGYDTSVIPYAPTSTVTNQLFGYRFSASRSSSVYGKSDTVQPTASIHLQHRRSA